MIKDNIEELMNSTIANCKFCLEIGKLNHYQARDVITSFRNVESYFVEQLQVIELYPAKYIMDEWEFLLTKSCRSGKFSNDDKGYTSSDLIDDVNDHLQRLNQINDLYDKTEESVLDKLSPTKWKGLAEFNIGVGIYLIEMEKERYTPFRVTILEDKEFIKELGEDNFSLKEAIVLSQTVPGDIFITDKAHRYPLDTVIGVLTNHYLTLLEDDFSIIRDS